MQLVLEKRAERSNTIALVSPLIAIAMTIVTLGIVFAILGKNPISALGVYFIDPLTDGYSLQEIAVKATPLVMIAIGLSLCYLANAWNIGAEGQFLVGAVAGSWLAVKTQGTDAGHTLGFDTGVLVAAMERQAELEATAAGGSSLLAVTEPTETAVAEAFAHTAVLAGRPGNQAPLREVGQLFGRVAHLLDAVEDYHDDVARGKWNPLAATGTPVSEVRALCDDAVLGIELALADVEFADPRLVRRLLVNEVRRAVSRTFAAQSGTPRGQQEPINFGPQSPGGGNLQPGEEGEVPVDPQARRNGRWGDCICCCDGCDCCCDCGDCCDCA